MACLFHYDLSIASLMCYVGNNYPGGYQNIEASVERTRGLVDNDLLTLYTRIMTLGAPSLLVAKSSLENSLLYW